MSSCHKTVIGRVTEVIYTPWRSGTIIQYKICFNKIEGKGLDSTYLIGNRIYIKDTYNPFYFEIGDSLKIKLGLTQYQNKFISIYKLVDREEKTLSGAQFLILTHLLYYQVHKPIKIINYQ